jgi:hypothetical protein
MKKIFTLAAALIMTASVWAQSPEKMSYQAVVRNASNALVTTQALGMQISILQGGATGTPVYIETQTPTTNANGLVSLEIGTGTLVSGDFTTIDWANDTYFIKTETDPTGGTSYTITGTTQLMSVPYALHAKTAESVTGTVNYTETDPTFIAWDKSTGISITESQISDLTHTVDTDTHIDSTGIAALGFVAGPHTDSIAIANMGFVASSANNTLSIGDSYEGGIIFWLDTTGQHGLIAATADLFTGMQWYNGTYTVTNAVKDGIYAGKYNTERIIANQGAGDYAAQICANYQGGNYGDWYLPSKYELNLLYAQKTAVGGFASAYYWSSIETNNGNAWIQNFDYGSQIDAGKPYPNRVRAVRAF